MYNKITYMSKVENRKEYKHNINLIKYSEDGLRKRCKGCVEEFEKLQTSGYCNECWSFYFREKRSGKISLKEIFKNFQYKWKLLEEKYKDVKKCNTCLIIKDKKEFHPDKKSVHGLQNRCKCCVKEYNDNYNPYLKENNKIKHKEYQKENKDRFKKLNKERYKNDSQYKISKLLRCRLYFAVKGFKIKSAIKLLGCTIEEFKIYLENQFKFGMTWENWGEVWEIDHIIGCINFNLKKLSEQKKCFHYTNMRPLFKTTDIAKQYGENQEGNRNRKKLHSFIGHR